MSPPSKKYSFQSIVSSYHYTPITKVTSRRKKLLCLSLNRWWSDECISVKIRLIRKDKTVRQWRTVSKRSWINYFLNLQMKLSLYQHIPNSYSKFCLKVVYLAERGVVPNDFSCICWLWSSLSKYSCVRNYYSKHFYCIPRCTSRHVKQIEGKSYVISITVRGKDLAVSSEEIIFATQFK